MAEDDPSSSQDFRSKLAFFKSINSRQYSKAKSGVGAKNEPSIHKSGATWMTSTVTHVPETESSSDSFDEIAATIEEVSTRNRRNFSPDDMEVFQKPMCLVSTDEQNVLTIEAGTVEQIARIDVPIVVVSVVGLYRTGKSYLMNCLAQSTKGFVLGNTTQSTTKGIWVWCKIHPKKSDTVLMLLDTEGLGDVEKGDANHDNKILTIATLLCNCLVYNMKGVLDQDAISKLTFVTEMERSIRYKGEGSIHLVLPYFVLCLRDFCLELSDGEKEDEYLENCLKSQKEKKDRFNKPRENIRNFFPVRRCFSFPPPGDVCVIKKLDTLEISALPEEFKTATQSFIEYIYSLQPKELLASKAINGQMFATLATHYVKAIQESAVTDVNDAFRAAANIENTRVEKEAFEIFETHMANLNLPVSYRFLENYCTSAQQATLNHLRKNVVHDTDGEYEQQAQMKFDNILDKVVEENTEKLNEMYVEKLIEAYQESIDAKIENGDFEVAGGYKEFQMSINRMKDNFMHNFRNFEDSEVITDTETTIIEADTCLPNAEKEAEKIQNKERNNKMLEKHKTSQADAFKKYQNALENNLGKQTVERKKQFLKDKQRYTRFFEEKLTEDKAIEELNKLEKQHEEKIQKMIEDGRKRNEDHITRLMEKHEKKQAESLDEERKKMEEQKEKLAQEKQKLQELEDQQKYKEEECETLKERIKQLEQENEKIKELEKQQISDKDQKQKEKRGKKSKAITLAAKPQKGKKGLLKAVLREYKSCTLQ